MSLRKLTAAGTKMTQEYHQTNNKQHKFRLSRFVIFHFLELDSNPTHFSPDLDRAIKRVLNNEKSSLLQVKGSYFTCRENYTKTYR